LPEHCTDKPSHTFPGRAGLKPEQILADGDGIFLVGKQLNDLPSGRRVDGDVNLYKHKSLYYRFYCARPIRQRTLSVSIVAISSSASTASPTFFNHDFKVPSEIDSAICGTFTVSAALWKHILVALYL